jgi:hypothetical protein
MYTPLRCSPRLAKKAFCRNSNDWKFIKSVPGRKWKLRLSTFEIESIKNTFKKWFLDADQLWLFGSRTDDEKKGGDIDLFVKTQIEDSFEIQNKKISFLVDLKKQIGDQKIDVVILSQSSKKDLPIYRSAEEQGVRLC